MYNYLQEILDVDILLSLFNKDDFNAYREFEQPLVKASWDVIAFIPSKEEDSDKITCGNALSSSKELQ